MPGMNTAGNLKTTGYFAIMPFLNYSLIACANPTVGQKRFDEKNGGRKCSLIEEVIALNMI
jgi:hypothetical protein